MTKTFRAYCFRNRAAIRKKRKVPDMLIQLILLLLAPAVLSGYLYEWFNGVKLTTEKRVVFLVISAFLINMLVYAAILLRGHDNVTWSLSSTSTLTSVSFCLKYMVLSLLFAVGISYASSLVKVVKRK